MVAHSQAAPDLRHAGGIGLLKFHFPTASAEVGHIRQVDGTETAAINAVKQSGPFRPIRSRLPTAAISRELPSQLQRLSGIDCEGMTREIRVRRGSVDVVVSIPGARIDDGV